METEIEAKFLNVDHALLRQKLVAMNSVCIQPMRTMRRTVYDFPDGTLRKLHNGWVRVRDEGDKVTMSYKQLNDRSLHGTKEAHLVVDSFAAGDAFLQAIGLIAKNYQETKRESWVIGNVEIDLDEWPWIKPFVEIEGPSEQAVRNVANELGIVWDDALHGSVEIAYQAEYDVTEAEVNSWQKITFTDVPDWLVAKRK